MKTMNVVLVRDDIMSRPQQQQKRISEQQQKELVKQQKDKKHNQD